jgi:L-rhamnose mutarotase
MTRRYALALDLAEDPRLIAEYERHHAAVWPSIEKSLRAAGIERLEIYRTGNRLFMVMEVSPAFSFDQKAAADAANPKVQEWEALMWAYQRALPWAKPGEKWMPMERIYHLAEIGIRDESPEDVAAIREVNRQAFGKDHEGRIVDALRANGAAALSLVATEGDAVVGHIMFSPLSVGAEVGVGLGPVAVVSSRQRRGVGSRLVEAGLERLGNGGCPFVIVIGHPSFYPRFGFRPAGDLGLTCEWDVAAEAFMVKVLNPDVAGRLQGRARYRPEFSIE